MRVIAGEGIEASHSSYSQGIIHNSTLYVSGQTGFDPFGGEAGDGGFSAQAAVAIENLLAVAAAAGARAEDALRINVHLADLDDFGTFDEVYRRYFSEPYPTRVTVGSQLFPGLLIEIDGVFAVLANAGEDQMTS
jgi:reactive intermediate/imine deaminase